MDRYACRLLLLQLLLGGSLLAGDPAVLQIRVTQGEQSAYRSGSETRNALVVEVTDDASHPVEGVAISFRLPPAGPGGQFMNGLGSEIVFTGADAERTPGTMESDARGFRYTDHSRERYNARRATGPSVDCGFRSRADGNGDGQPQGARGWIGPKMASPNADCGRCCSRIVRHLRRHA